MNRLASYSVFCGLCSAWATASYPTNTSPDTLKTVRVPLCTAPLKYCYWSTRNTQLFTYKGYSSRNTQLFSYTGYSSRNTQLFSYTDYSSRNTQLFSYTGYSSRNTQLFSYTGYSSRKTQLFSYTGYSSRKTQLFSNTGYSSLQGRSMFLGHTYKIISPRWIEMKYNIDQCSAIFTVCTWSVHNELLINIRLYIHVTYL